MKKNNIFWQYLFAIIIIGLIFFWSDFSKTNSDFLEITVFDVGQGDAILIQTPDNQQILIDGGPNKQIIDKLGEVLPFWDRSIDILILTHPHADHLTGLLEVLDRYSVGQIITTNIEYDSSEYKEWQDYIKNNQEKVVYVNGEQVIKSDKFNLEIIFPNKKYLDNSQENINNTSVISKVKFGNFSMLFTGDAECEEQDQLLNFDIDVDVLKVPHQGAEDSACENFLKSTSPEIAVISVGKNNQFGHPHQSHLELLNDLIPDRDGQEIFRTDQDSDIHIYSDQNSYWIQTAK